MRRPLSPAECRLFAVPAVVLLGLFIIPRLTPGRSQRRYVPRPTPTTPPVIGLSALAISPDSGTVATVDVLRRIRFWDTASGIRQGEGATSPSLPNSAAFSPDGQIFAVGSRFALSLFDCSYGPLSTSYPERSTTIQTIRELKFTPDSKTIVGAGLSGVWSWPLPSLEPSSRAALGSFEEIAADISPEGATVVATGSVNSASNTQIVGWDLKKGRKLWTKPHISVGAVRFLDWRRVAVAMENEVDLLHPQTGLIERQGPWRVLVEDPKTRFTARSDTPRHMAFSKTANSLLAVDSGGHLLSLNLGTSYTIDWMQLRFAISKITKARLQFLEIANDGNIVAVSTMDGQLLVFNVTALATGIGNRKPKLLWHLDIKSEQMVNGKPANSQSNLQKLRRGGS